MPVTFPTSKLTILVELQLADGTWVDVSSYVLWANRVIITRGRQKGSRRGRTSTCTLTFRNSDKRFSPRNVSGPYYGSLKAGTPIRVSADPGTGSIRRFTGNVPSWAPQVNGHPNDRRVPIRAVGPLDAIERDNAPLLSSPRRYLPTTAPTAPLHYWPMEDGELADQLGRPDNGTTSLYAFTGTHPSGAVISPPQWGRGTLAPWLPTVLSRSGAAGLTVVAANVIMAASPTEWTIDMMYAMGTDVGADTVDLTGAAIDINPSYLGGVTSWPQLQFVASLAQFAVSINGEADRTTASVPEAFDGKGHHLRWTVRQFGANVSWNLWIDGVQKTFDVNVTTGAMTLPVVTSIGLMAAASASGLAQGHLAIWSGTAPTLSSVRDVAFGRAGTESAAFRFERLLGEEDILCIVNEGDTDNQLMGPQRASTLAELLHECEDVNEGLIDEATDGTLRLNSRTARFGQSVAFTLNYGAAEIIESFSPADDVDQLYNDWSMTRPDGATVRYRVEEGATSVSPYPDGIGPRPTSGSANLYSDTQVAAHAAYRAHRDSVDRPRFERIRVELAKKPTLITTWLATDIGDRVQITSPPADAGPDTLDMTLEGYTETFDQAAWDLGLYLEPGDVSTAVAEYDDTAARYDCPGSTLHAPLDATETAVRVAVNCCAPAVCKWAHADGNYVTAAAGETMTVTAVSSPAGSFVNVGTATHADNASVTPGMPAGTVKGDLLLVFAAIRNTAATVATPSGYTALMADGNVILLGKIHSGTESAPAVTFTGGSAGDTTTAVMAAFRAVQLDTTSTAGQTNGSAQNVSFPAAVIARARSLVLWLGWKQDDWTSAGALFGGTTEISEASTTTGSDQALVWDYVVQTDPTDYASAFWTIVGGAAAISKGYVVVMPCDVQTLTVTRSTNAVSKTHMAGERFGLATPTRWAL